MDLKSLIVSELHKPARKNYPRRQTVIKGLNDLYQADLVEMIPHSKTNGGFKYILTLIDCFTKVAYALPLKNKTGITVSEAMKTLIKTNNLQITHLQTDNGKEYFNKWFSNLMSQKNINHYSTFSEKKLQ